MLLGAVARIQAEIPVVFPVHPRTRRRLEALAGVAAADARRFASPIRCRTSTSSS